MSRKSENGIECYFCRKKRKILSFYKKRTNFNILRHRISFRSIVSVKEGDFCLEPMSVGNEKVLTDQQMYQNCLRALLCGIDGIVWIMHMNLLT